MGLFGLFSLEGVSDVSVFAAASCGCDTFNIFRMGFVSRIVQKSVGHVL